MDVSAEAVGKRIKKIRMQKDMTAVDLAKKIGVARSTISMYENGNMKSISTDLISKIAKVLDVEISVLINDDHEKSEVRKMSTNKKFTVGDFIAKTRGMVLYAFSESDEPLVSADFFKKYRNADKWDQEVDDVTMIPCRAHESRWYDSVICLIRLKEK